MNSSTVSTPPAFDLRCREAEWLDRSQTVAEFGRVVELPANARNVGLGEALVADLIARSHYEIDEIAQGRTILSCEMPRYGIPLGARDLERPPSMAWNMREELSGELLELDLAGRPTQSVAMQVRRGLIAVAGALPLLVGMPAFASPPTGSVDQVEVVAPPVLPDNEQGTPAEPTPESTAAPATAAPATAAPASAAPATAAPATAVAPAARVSGGSLSLNGMVVWEGLLGQLVRLELKDGKTLAGTVVAQSSGDLAIARASDGMVVSVPKAQVGGVRMRPQDAGAGGGPVGSDMPVGARPVHDGRGFAGGGIVLLAVGSITALTGTVFLAISPSYVGFSLPFLLPGLALIGGGSGMLAVAGKKRKAYKKAWGIPTSRLQMTPTIKASRQGGQAGLVLRF